MPPAAIRRAVPTDANAIARVHVEAWRETYRGIVPDAVLAGLSVERREEGWRGLLAGESADQAAFVAEDAGTAVGFAHAGKRRGTELAATGEIYAIYVLRHAQRRGVGRALMRRVAGFLADRGIGSVGLWVARENLPARAFYSALGGRETAARDVTGQGFTLAEVACEWADLAALADRDGGAC